jgi:hypothetical protein
MPRHFNSIPDEEDVEAYRDVAEQIVSLFTGKTNNIGLHEPAFAQALVNAMHRQHRTLQANVIRVLQHFLVEYGKRDGMQWVDLRNKAAVELCQKVTPLLIDSYVPTI